MSNGIFSFYSFIDDTPWSNMKKKKKKKNSSPFGASVNKVSVPP
jgi:hypothetical protein